MYKQIAKKTIAILTLLFCVMLGCVAPNAVKTEIQGIRNDMGALKKLVKREVTEGRFNERDRQNLGNFAQKKGTFAEQK